jgi:glycosyltransferase involved in cell wall biosynthesis
MPRGAGPAVSVAICLFNSARFIDETLASVFAQTSRDFELILVDDGSSDGCADAIERRYRDPRMRLIRQRHHGLSLSRRRCIASAAGEYVAFLDHDDLWRPDKLERQLAVARADPSLALLCSDCTYIDERSRPVGRLSDHYGLADLEIAAAYAELLRRGCFVWQSTVLAKTAVLKTVDSFNPAFPYIADYDTWLRIAKRYRLHYDPDVLAMWRVHRTQFTSRCPDITLADHRALLGPLSRTMSIPAPIRVAIGDRLLGQHRVSCRALLQQRRFGLAMRAAAGMFSYPDRLLAFCLGAVAQTRVAGPALLHAYKRLRRRLRARRGAAPPAAGPPPLAPAHVWIDGSALGLPQAGQFTLVTELVRRLASEGTVVHVETTAAGRRALQQRIGPAHASLRIHGSSRVARAIRWCRLAVLPDPREITEVIVWRGRFRWRRSRKVAVVQDLTTLIHPELHTPRNVSDVDEFLAYVHRRAETIVTISESSRRDIIERLSVFPGAVSVIPMPVHPCFVQPQFDRRVVLAHGIDRPYILTVGCIEPRKNLRRLARAFELVQDEPAFRDVALVIVGPQGWDDSFVRDLADAGSSRRVRVAGVVPTEHLPSLYHFASAVVYPSLYEGFGLPIFEAMCSSAVVLASRTSSMPEVLGEGGMVFDPYDEKAIAATMLHALKMTAAGAIAYRQRCRDQAEMRLARSARVPALPGLPAPASTAVIA